MTTKLEQAARQALEALEQHVERFDYEQFTSVCELDPAKDAILALREALAEQVEQEPVAWVEVERGIPMFMNFTDDYKPNIGNGIAPLYAAPQPVQQAEQEPVAYAPIITFLDAQHYSVSKQKKPEYCNPLYAAPVRTKDLTDDEIRDAFYSCGFGAIVVDGCRAVIAADREKNK